MQQDNAMTYQVTVIYHKEDTKVGSQTLATKFGFVADWLQPPHIKKEKK